jgi:predicted Rossmann fold flavoprotein
MALSPEVVIIGGGAAGLMCAIEAGKRGRRVLLLEHGPRLGRKVLISGGGRCNFTNLQTRPENFLCANPHFPKSALARYRPEDFLHLVERYSIPYHEKAQGQLFCDRSAADIMGMLERECAAVGVRTETACEVRRVARNGCFEVETTGGTLQTGALVVATGGLSIPKLGATSFGYDLARQFGLKVVGCRPALVPLVFSHSDMRRYDGLAGVSTPVTARTSTAVFHDKLLFTHRGLSGPAVLQASSYWEPGMQVSIDLLPGVQLTSLLRHHRTQGDRSEARTIVSRLLPNRLADRWFELLGISKPAAMLSDREIQALSDGFQKWDFQPAGTEGYEKAEVTVGGVDTAELSSKTFESRWVPGLYFIGEVVDVTGHLGGFNFQWAWASGYSAGQYV